MNNPKPLVSIGMPLYNEGEHLAEALDSLLAQDYTNFEIVISDNASVDKTAEICQAYALKDPRLKVHRFESTADASENFNRTFQLSKGEFFMWAAGHDKYAPTFISTCLGEMMRNPENVLCFTRIIPMTVEGQILEPLPLRIVQTEGIQSRVLRYILAFLYWGGWDAYALYRSSALKKTKLFPHNTMGPDFVLFSELALLGTFAVVREPLFYLRLNRISEKTADDMFSRYKKTMFFSKKRSFLWFPHWRLFYEYFLVLKRASLSLRRKLILFAILARLFLSRYSRMLFLDLLRPLLEIARKTRKPLLTRELEDYKS